MATVTKKRRQPVRSRARKRPVPQTAQQTIPYRQMLEDGTCHVREGYYTKTMQYGDINYSTESPDNQSIIFDGYCGYLNYFDCAVPFQQSFIKRRNRPGDNGRVNILPQDDDCNSIRKEFVGILEGGIARSNNGYNISRYVTYGIHVPEGLRVARPRLERIEADIQGNFKKLGVQAQPLAGVDRLAVLHGQLHPGSREPFRFSWDMIPKTGLATKDFIAPTSFDFKQSRAFRTGKVWGAVSHLQITASEISDKMLAELLEVDAEMTITMHLQAVDQAEAIKTIKAKVSDIDKMKVEEQKRAVRSGYDMDILPPDIITYSRDAAALLGDLQSRNERLFLMTFLILNTAPTRQQLENEVFQISGIAQKHNCSVKRLDFQQEQGYMSSLVLGANSIEIQRGMTTSSTAIFIPFMTQELRMGGPSIYYGQNALSHNVILADRKKLKNPNGLYLGVPGSGKSFAGKRELLNVFLATKDRIIVVDVMGEYAALVRRLGGQVVELSPDSLHHINPCAFSTKGMEDENPLSLKADFLLSLCELIVADKQGLQPVERTVIDRCVRMMYQDHIANPGEREMPLLRDLHALLEKQPEPEARRIATALELYVSGSLNVFNFPTNVDLSSRIVCFDLKKLGSMLRTIAMHIVNDFVTSQVSANFAEGIATWCYFDEFHVLLQDELTASYFVRIWKMLRKKFCIPSALTQNVKDLLTSTAIEALFENTSVYVLLAQAPGDRAILSSALGCSESQLAYVDNSNPGEGLLIFGDSIIPFVDRFPKNTEIYRLLTTRPEDIVNEAG